VRVGVLVAGAAVLVGVSDGVAVGVFVGVGDGVAVFVGVAVRVLVAVGVELGTCVLVGTAVLVLVGTGVGVYGMQIPFWQVPFRHSALVQHAPKGRHIGAPGPNEQQCSESAQQAFPHTWAAGQQYCPLSIQTPEQQPSTVQTGSPGSQHSPSWVQMPKQHQPSQQTDCPETQHSAPHMSLPSGQQQSWPQGIWLPGQVGGRGVGVGRRCASMGAGSRITAPIAAAPPTPKSPLIARRRLTPLASRFASASNCRSSMNRPLERKRIRGSDPFVVGRHHTGSRVDPGVSPWPLHALEGRRTRTHS